MLELDPLFAGDLLQDEAFRTPAIATFPAASPAGHDLTLDRVEEHLVCGGSFRAGSLGADGPLPQARRRAI
ncbi:MAG TPA: hypothetical protein VMK12_05325 [Anaeromyxobacteraceae bacterium]|nr:hypothetical protein [Anaeromyxobacteraceae bacterium]